MLSMFFIVKMTMQVLECVNVPFAMPYMLYVPECYAFCHVMPCIVDISTNSCFQLSSVASLHDRALLRVLCETPPRLRKQQKAMRGSQVSSIHQPEDREDVR